MKINFLGGAGTVTGSKTLIEHDTMRILIDCGMFQGNKDLRQLNWEDFPINPMTIDFVLLTHGHLDHCGWLPRLVQQGFQGKIICTSPTATIAKLILLDSAKIQEEEAANANEKNYSKHHPAEPLYTVDDAKKVLSKFRIISLDEIFKISDIISVKLHYAGHIIGATSIELKIDDTVLFFSGDIGRKNDVLMYPPIGPKKADYLFLESTYGDKLHPDEDTMFLLETFINNTVNKNGNVLIPSFAVERIQTLMYMLWQLKKQKRLPDIPLIIDSPMGVNVLDVFLQNPLWHRLNPHECEEMCNMFTLISDFKDTLEVLYDKKPKLVVAASGMVTGGRILTYLERLIEKPETTVILVGFQAEGTRGKRLLEGEKEVKIYGNYYQVNATILQIEGLSAHGDQQDLLDWLKELEEKPKKIFLVHGEQIALQSLKEKIEEIYSIECYIPYIGYQMSI